MFALAGSRAVRISFRQVCSVKSTPSCNCVCHKGGIVLHVVPCCDRMPVRLSKKPEPKKSARKPRE